MPDQQREPLRAVIARHGLSASKALGQNFLLDAVSPPKRARCTAYLNLIQSFGILVGGVAGSIMINYIPNHIGSVRWEQKAFEDADKAMKDLGEDMKSLENDIHTQVPAAGLRLSMAA